MQPNLVILGGNGSSTWILVNYIKKYFNIDLIIIENPPSKFKLLKNRIKRIGFTKVFGQILFQFFLVPLLKIESKERKKNILKDHDLSISKNMISNVEYVESVNSENVIKRLLEINPTIVIINGTRILSKKVLTVIESPFINIHAGITPKYRGVHGAYWALVNNDLENVGVTIHLVDPGIDTGAILYQGKINKLSEDNFLTYPLLQLTNALPQLVPIINAYIGTRELRKIDSNLMESKLWYHPTLLGYIYHRFVNKVK